MESRQDPQVLNLKLLLAIRDSNVADINRLLTEGADLAQCDEKGKTPIEYAAEQKLWASVGAIAKSKKTDEKDTYHYRQALMLAADNKQLNLMCDLLDAGASANGVYRDYVSLLHWAVSEYYSMIEILVKHGADMTVCDDSKMTPISFAAKHGKWEAVKKLIQLGGTEVDSKLGYKHALLYAVDANYPDIVDLFLKAGAQTTGYYNETKNTSLHVAAQNGFIDCMTFLIRHRADLSARNTVGKTPIQAARNYAVVQHIARLANTDANDSFGYNAVLRDVCIHGDFATAEALLKAGANPNYIDPDSKLSMLETAHANGSLKLLPLLVKYGADLSHMDSDKKTLMQKLGYGMSWTTIQEIIQVKQADRSDTYEYRSALLYAVTFDQTSLVTKLLKAGAGTDSCYTGTNNTSLHEAVKCANVEILKLLIEHGADLAKENNDKKTPMQLALAGNNSVTKWKLVEAIAAAKKTNAEDTFHYRDALLAAARENRQGTVNILLNAGAPAYGSIGTETLLHRAIRDNDEKLIERLLQNRADLAEKNNSGQTAMDYAVSLGRWNCVALLAKLKKNDEKNTYHYGEALYEAIANGVQWTTIHALLDADALNTHKDNARLKNIMHLGISDGRTEVVTGLARHGADLTVANSDNYTPIQRLANRGEWSLVEKVAEIRQYDEKNSYRYGSALESAVYNNQYNAAEALLKANASKAWTRDNVGMLQTAISNDNLKMLKLLLKHNVNRAYIYNDKTPVEFAAESGKWEYVKAFLDYPTDAKDAYHYGKAALLYMKSSERNRKGMKAFIEAGVCENKTNANLLFANAVSFGELDIVKDLLDAGAEINCQLKVRGTTLHMAVENNNATMLRLLLERGASQTKLNDAMQTPAEYAAELGNWECLQVLVDFNRHNGNNAASAEDLHYEQALLAAIKKGHYAAAKLLLEQHARFDRCSLELGNIALYWAVKGNAPEIVSLLIDHGVNTTVRNQAGKTILEVAGELGFAECVKRLKNHSVYIKPGKTAEDYRKDAADIYQEMIDNSIQPVEMPAAIQNLQACQMALLKLDLESLKRQREAMKKGEVTIPAPQPGESLMDVITVNPMAELEKINGLIMIINALLSAPDQQPSPTLLRKTTGVESQDVQNYLTRRSQTEAFYQRVRGFLSKLESDIHSKIWYKKGIFNIQVKGTPKHIDLLAAALKKLPKAVTHDDVYAIFVDVIEIIMSVDKLERRHEDTEYFYQSQLDKLRTFTFVPVSSSPEREPRAWQDVGSKNDVIASTLVEEKKASATTSMYPTLPSSEPILFQQPAPNLAAPQVFIPQGFGFQAAAVPAPVPTAPPKSPAPVKPAAAMPAADNTDAIIAGMPDVPQRSLSQMSIFSSTETKEKSAGTAEKKRALLG